MKLNTLISYKKRKKVIGRGIGSGHGKQSTRGGKGQTARSGKKLRPDFEGGQTPLIQRLPKYRGFKNPNKVEVQIINVADLDRVSGKEISKEILVKHGLVQRLDLPVKILGDGELKKAFQVTLDQASKSAVDKITKAGGTFISSMKLPHVQARPNLAK